MSGEPAPWVIEFRSGSFFRATEDDRGSDFASARRFPTKQACSDFMDANPWMRLNGPMPRQIGTGRDWPGAPPKP